MIRFRNAMGYYDIHTHQMPFHKEDIAIINRIVSPMGDMQPGSLPDTVIRSYGIHPWYIYNVKEQMDLLRVLVSGSGVVAIGEAGLDTLAESPMDLQKEGEVLNWPTMRSEIPGMRSLFVALLSGAI